MGNLLSRGSVTIRSSMASVWAYCLGGFSYQGSERLSLGIGNPPGLAPAQVPACPSVSLCGNLLPNGDFGYAVEPKDVVWFNNITQTSCWESVPDDIWQVGGSPDYFTAGAQASSLLGVPDNRFGTQADASPFEPDLNHGYAGIATTGFRGGQLQDYTEYLYQRLRFGSGGTNDLKPNKHYYAGFKASLAETSNYASKIGLHFDFYDENLGPYPPHYHGFIPTIPSISSSGIITNKTSWTSIGGIYLASGYERCIVIGRFLTPVSGATPNQAEDLISVTPSASPVADASYYYIDDIVITELPDAGEDKTVACGTPVIIGSERTAQACGEYLIPEGSSWEWSVPGAATLPLGLLDDPHALRPTVTTAEDVTLRFTFTDPHGNSFHDDVQVNVTTGTPFTPHVSVRCGPTNNYLIRMDVAPAAVAPKTALERFNGTGYTSISEANVDEFSINGGFQDGTYRITRTYSNGCYAVCTFDMLGLDYSSPKYSGGTFDNDIFVYNDITLLSTVTMNSGIRVYVAGRAQTPTVASDCLPNETITSSKIQIGNGSTSSVLKLNGTLSVQGICSFWKGFVVKPNADMDFSDAANIDVSDAEIGIRIQNTAASHTIANVDFYNCLTGIECSGTVTGLAANWLTYDVRAQTLKPPFDVERARSYDECYGSVFNPGFTGKAGILWPAMEGSLSVRQSSFKNGVVGIAAAGGNIDIEEDSKVTGIWHGLLCRPNELKAVGSTFRAGYKAGLAQHAGTAKLQENVFGDVSDRAFFLHYSLFDPAYTGGTLLQDNGYWMDLEELVAMFSTNRVGLHLLETGSTNIEGNTVRNGSRAAYSRSVAPGYFNTGILLDACDQVGLVGNTIYNMAVGIRLQGMQPPASKTIVSNSFYTNTKHIYFAPSYARDNDAESMTLRCNVFEDENSVLRTSSTDVRYGLFIAAGALVEPVGTCDDRSGNAFPGPNLVLPFQYAGSHNHVLPTQVDLAYASLASHFTSIRNEASDAFRYYKYSNEYVPGISSGSGGGLVRVIAPPSLSDPSGQCTSYNVWDSPINPDPSIINPESPCDNLPEQYFLLTKQRIPNARTGSAELSVPIALYPNPATGSVQVKGLAGESVSSVILVDMLGRSQHPAFEHEAEGILITLPSASGIYRVAIVLTDGTIQSLGRLCVR